MTVYGQGVRSAAADMFERGLGRDAVACALGIPSCAVRKWHETFRAVGREVLLDMGKARSYDWETKVAAASAVVDSGRAKPEVMGGIRDSVEIAAGLLVPQVPRMRG